MMEDPLAPSLHRAAGAGLAQEVRRLLEAEASVETHFNHHDRDTSRFTQLGTDNAKHINNNVDNYMVKEEVKERDKNCELSNGWEVIEGKGNDSNANDSAHNRLRETASNGPHKEIHNSSSAVQVKDVDGRTALHAAVEAAGAGAAEAVQLLLNAGADVRARDSSGATPLHLASYWGHAAAAQHLLRAGADSEEEWLADLNVMMRDARVGGASDARLGDGRLPLAALHLAAGAGHVATIEVLLESGADPNAATSRGSTPLHLAVAGGHEAALLAAGASVLAADDEGRSPLHTAAFTGRPTPLRMLLSHVHDKVAALGEGDARGATPLHLAAGGGLAEVLRRILRASEHEDADAMWKRPALKELQQQVSEGVSETVDLLLAAGATVDLRDVGGAQPLHYAALCGRTGSIRALLNAGADPEVRALLRPCPPLENDALRDALQMHATQHGNGPIIDQGIAALHAAASAPEESHIAAMSLLMETGANTEAMATGKQGDGRRPLHVVAHLGRVPAIEALLEAGVDAEATDACGRTPLHEAAARGHTLAVQTLLSAGASANAVEVRGATPLHFAASAPVNADSLVAALLAGGASIGAGDERGVTSLHRACFLGRATVCGALLEAGASPSTADARGRSPLHAAAAGGIDVVEGGDGGEGGARVVRLLIDAGADVNARDARGAAPLHRAVETGNTKVVRGLLERGADPEITWNFKLSTGPPSTENAGRPEVLLHAIRVSLEKENLYDERAYRESKGDKTIPDIFEKQRDINEMGESDEEVGLLASHIAAANGHVNVLRMLLRAGLSPSGKKSQTNPSTMSLSRRKSSGTVKKFSREKIESMSDNDLALAHNDRQANVTGQSERTEKVSSIQASHSHSRISEMIFPPSLPTKTSGENACFSIKESDVTPLHLAAAGGHEETVRLLLRSVMDTDCSMDESEVNELIRKVAEDTKVVPVGTERKSSNGTARRTSNGTDRRSSNGSGRRWSLWSSRKASSEESESVSLAQQQARDGRTALHSAALRRDSAVANALLEAGADATAEDSLGNVPGALADDPALRTILGCPPQPCQRNSVSLEEADAVRSSRCCCVL